MEDLINSFITTVNNLSIQSTLSLILGSHILPVLSNILYTGFVWILFSIYLYVYTRDKKLIVFTILGLFISAVLGNEILRPILFHFRDSLLQYNFGLYLPEINKFIFPSGYPMMTVASLVIVFYMSRDYFKYGLAIGAIWFFIHLNVITSYPVDFIFGIIMGLIIGFLLCQFNKKKEEEEEAYEELAGKFHF